MDSHRLTGQPLRSALSWLERELNGVTAAQIADPASRAATLLRAREMQGQLAAWLTAFTPPAAPLQNATPPRAIPAPEIHK